MPYILCYIPFRRQCTECLIACEFRQGRLSQGRWAQATQFSFCLLSHGLPSSPPLRGAAAREQKNFNDEERSSLFFESSSQIKQTGTKEEGELIMIIIKCISP